MCDNPRGFPQTPPNALQPMPSRILTQPLRLVLDTNIVMDMLHFCDPATVWLENAIRQGRAGCHADDATLTELERVLAYPEFHLDAAAQTRLLQHYLQIATRCEKEEHENFDLPSCRDGDDQKFLELTARCQAQMLVTRDKELLKLARKRRSAPFAIVTAVEAERLFRFALETDKAD